MASPKRSLGSTVGEQALLLEEADEALPDGVDAGLVVAAAVDVHDLAQQRQHRLLLRGQPIGDGCFLRRRLGHVLPLERNSKCSCQRHRAEAARHTPSQQAVPVVAAAANRAISACGGGCAR